VFGAGGGTNSYREVEETDLVLLWGSNAREAHPIFFHHVIKGLRRGARLVVVDPRRTPTAEWADEWLPVQVGADIALANAFAHAILDEHLENRAFIKRATVGFAEFAAHVSSPACSPEATEAVTGVPAAQLRKVARAYATADRAMICWTLGITEHHDAVDNVLSLINLALTTGQVGRWGAGLNPLRGQNNVQGGGDMGALPHKLAGFQDVQDAAVRARFDATWKTTIPPQNGWNLTEMFLAMERKELRGLLVFGENPAQSEANAGHTRELLSDLDILVVQDLFLTRTAELADVVLPGSASWCETDGTVTNSERRVQRVRKAVSPPEGARDDFWILGELGRRMGHDLGDLSPEALWNELRTLSPMHGGMSWARIEELGGIQWPCPDEQSEGSPFLHGRLWKDPVEGRRAPFTVTRHEGPLEQVSAEYPFRLTTGRRLYAYNTHVQTQHFTSPLHRGETVDMFPADAAALGLVDGERVRMSSPRGSVELPVHLDPNLRPGLVFMTFHFLEDADANTLTTDAFDPKSGTAEFKAASVRIEKLALPDTAAAEE